MLVLILAFINFNTWAAEKPEEFILCRNAKTVRTIRVQKSQEKNGEWVTLYTKSGVDKVVGTGYSLESNVKIAGNIKRNLEEAGWRCRNVNETAVSNVETRQ